MENTPDRLRLLEVQQDYEEIYSRQKSIYEIIALIMNDVDRDDGIKTKNQDDIQLNQICC